jgi:hypothetical protein
MWELVFHERPAEFIRNQRGVKLGKLRALLEEIAAAPFSTPDDVVRSASGRAHEVRYTAEFTVIYWVDVLVKEVRVVEIRSH